MTLTALRERLAHLSLPKVQKRLGPGGADLLRKGSSLASEADFQWKRRRLDCMVDGATVRLEHDPGSPLHLGAECSECTGCCYHIAGALQFVLDEKVALGLAEPPPELETRSAPLTDTELIERALEERRERAERERMTLRSSRPRELWTDYSVTSKASGKSYRVALRGSEPGESYCTCADFRTNTLGTCKHILYALSRVRKKFKASTFKKPPRRSRTSVHLVFGPSIELRLAPEDGLDEWASGELAPFVGRAITNVKRLLRVLATLEASGYPVLIYPDAEEWIETRLLQARLERTRQEIRANPARHPLRQTLLKAELLPYQLDGIAFAVGARRAILADDMGLGKTIQGIGVAELLGQMAGIERVLVVCPASVKGQWASEIARFSERTAQVVSGPADRRREHYGAAFFTICNYEQVLRDTSVIEECGFDLVILDEAQRIKNWEAKTTAAIKGIRTPFALVLTGTPIENRIDELYSIVEFVDEQRLAPAFRFFNRHRVLNEDGRLVGYRDLDELRAQLAPILLRRTRALVLDDLPPRTTEVIRIDPTVEQVELHDAHYRTAQRIAAKKFLSEMDLLRLQKALLMARMAADSAALLGPDEPEASSKLERLEELMRSLLGEVGRKVIIFSEWTRMLDRIEAMLEAMGAQPLRLDGSVPQQKRKGIVDAFQGDPKARVILLSNAGTTGLNLQAADTVVNVDLPWNPAVLEQRIGRAHRMGQARAVQVYLLVTTGTIEEGMLGTLASKHELFQAVLDPDSDVDEVRTGGGLEGLRARLEVILGPPPTLEVVTRAAAPASGSSAGEVADRLGLAAGGLVQAAFALLDQLAGAPSSTPVAGTAAATAAARLLEGAGRDAAGRPTLALTFPDDEALAAVARTFARLASLGAADEAERRD